VISNFEIVGWLSKQGLEKTHPLNHGGGRTFDFGRVKFVNAVHSSQLPDGSYGGNPGGLVVHSDQEAFSYSGDTALTHDMHFIAQEFELRFAVLCVGDNLRWGRVCRQSRRTPRSASPGHYDISPDPDRS
jgi:L-ascorbate metabolism protein UlaG (beta-lactamase superfamily)